MPNYIRTNPWIEAATAGRGITDSLMNAFAQAPILRAQAEAMRLQNQLTQQELQYNPQKQAATLGQLAAQTKLHELQGETEKEQGKYYGAQAGKATQETDDMKRQGALGQAAGRAMFSIAQRGNADPADMAAFQEYFARNPKDADQVSKGLINLAALLDAQKVQHGAFALGGGKLEDTGYKLGANQLMANSQGQPIAYGTQVLGQGERSYGYQPGASRTVSFAPPTVPGQLNTQLQGMPPFSLDMQEPGGMQETAYNEPREGAARNSPSLSALISHYSSIVNNKWNLPNDPEVVHAKQRLAEYDRLAYGQQQGVGQRTSVPRPAGKTNAELIKYAEDAKRANPAKAAEIDALLQEWLKQ